MPTIAIVGGGLSGSLVAIHFLRLAVGQKNLDIHLFEGKNEVGRGVAYSTQSSAHLLNVPRESMSLFPESPDHFVQWLKAAGRFDEGNRFISRGCYGDYVVDTLSEAVEKKDPAIDWQVHAEWVVSVTPDEGNGAIIQGSLGTILPVDTIILATGNPPPGAPCPVPDSPRYIANPWEVLQWDQAYYQQTVLILGTGLTMVDMVLSLVEQGHTGKIYALSRHGMIPTAYPASGIPSVKAVTGEDVSIPMRLKPLIRWVQERLRAEGAKGGSGDSQRLGIAWQRVLETLRPHLPRLWQQFSVLEKRQFLCHVRPYWEVYRHRLPPAVHEQVMGLLGSGRLEILKGTMIRIAPHPEGLQLQYRPRGASTTTLQELNVAWVMNATGPNTRVATLENPLLQKLLKQGLIHADPFQLGLSATDSGQVLDVLGAPVPFLYTLGPPLKGQLWETTAVPEIRTQAQALAALLLDKCFAQPYSAQTQGVGQA